MAGRAIFLVGLMGSGKTTVGKILARGMGRRFVDTDSLVEARSGRRVAEIFAAQGEPAFRRLEEKALKSIDLKRGLVVATGGGIVTRPSNLAWMKRHGVVVYLSLSARSIFRRLGPGQRRRRPLLAGGLSGLKSLAAQRAPLYAQAHLRVAAARRPQAVAKTILRRVDSQKVPC